MKQAPASILHPSIVSDGTLRNDRSAGMRAALACLSELKVALHATRQTTLLNVM